MRLEDANQLLEPGYLPMESGYTRLPNGDMYIAVLTRMPGGLGMLETLINTRCGIPTTIS